MIEINIEFKIIRHAKMLKYHPSIEYLNQPLEYSTILWNKRMLGN